MGGSGNLPGQINKDVNLGHNNSNIRNIIM